MLRSHRSLQAGAATNSEEALCTSKEPPMTHIDTNIHTTDIITVTYFPLSVVKCLQLQPKVLVTEKQYEPFLQFVWSLSVSPGEQTQRRDGLLLWQPATPSPL